ncbi:MAG: hypothetical protein ACR2HM_05480 [Acidimicrobiales bacterium]
MNGEELDGAPGSPPSHERLPRVFLSYAHDDVAFSDLVRRFYKFLRMDRGIDAVFDRVAAQSPQEWTSWMIRQMAEAELAPDVRRGAQWETRHLREVFYADAGAARARVLPVVLPGRHYTVEDFSPQAAEKLLRYLTGQASDRGASTLPTGSDPGALGYADWAGAFADALPRRPKK